MMRWECSLFTPSESPGVRSLPGPGCGVLPPVLTGSI